jgi:iron complex outermembrane receptor protein
MLIRNRFQLYVAPLVLALSLGALPALAQEAQPVPEPQADPAAEPQAQPGDTVEEIVITTQKRAQNLQDVPISVTALTGDELAKLGTGPQDRLPVR